MPAVRKISTDAMRTDERAHHVQHGHIDVTPGTIDLRRGGATLPVMKRIALVTLLVAGCSGDNLNTSRGPNGETVVGNEVSVQITSAANQSAAFSLAEDYCRKNKRAARFVAQTGGTAAFDCVKTS
jgi:hypothetical protein